MPAKPRSPTLSPRKTRNQRKRTLSVLSDKSIKVAKKRREEEEEEERSARAEDDDDDDDVNEEGAKKTGKQRCKNPGDTGSHQ
ncbi:hypothetical protein M378DRAFT_18102 [Amanita muscaria Koide BX008]|uniref:Uncharacterized protein n=1 Tax=Amanita muscaria (strain Koide BX008) TaxID=946122 RepID=A0A0C2WF70_AMAMK|nr:hypothetical protein M378DRAFT_18102 [Amanita muscaria Koide BX008]